MNASVRAVVAHASMAMTPCDPTMNPVLLIHHVPSCWMYAKIPSDTSVGDAGVGSGPAAWLWA